MFKLACGDVMPGCSARFENADHDQLMAQVAEHAGSAHGLTDITPEVLRTIEGQVAFVA